MSTKTRWHSWSKRRPSTSEPYQVVGLGGLLPIDMSVCNDAKETALVSPVKNTRKSGRRRPPALTIVPPDYNDSNFNYLSPVSANHNAPFIHSSTSLLALVNDTLQVWSPTTARPRPSLSIHKPLPSRPRSVSLPSTPNLPVELPGSILLENQGFPSPPPVAGPISATFGTMRSVRSGSALNTSARPSPSKVPHHKKSLSEASLKGHAKSRNSLLTLQSNDSRLTTCSEKNTNGGPTSSSDSIKASIGLEALQPSPLIVAGRPRKRNRAETTGCRREQSGAYPASMQVEELKATITTQDQTISTLQAQFASLRVSHEAHVVRLADAHAAELASLKSYTKALEEQQQQKSLHHASSNHLLFVLDTTDPQSPSTKASPRSAGSNSTTTTRSTKSVPSSPARVSPRRGPLTPEMEHLKRRLTVTKRHEIDHDNLIRERDLYRNNCDAFEAQIARLTGRLNQVKDERDEYAKTCKNLEFAREELEKKASKSEKSTLALQNTVDHLEYRLELANVQKLDAEEQVYHLRTRTSPFNDANSANSLRDRSSKFKNHQSMRTSAGTVFIEDSPLYQFPDLVPTDLAPFIARIERLQEQIHEEEMHKAQLEAIWDEEAQIIDRRDEQFREVDARNLRLKATIADLKQSGTLLEQQMRAKDEHNRQLQASLESLQELYARLEKQCVNKDQLSQLTRQLDTHKLLLEMEVKRNAKLTLLAGVEDPHTDLPALVSRHDVNRWIDQLQSRLKKTKAGEGSYDGSARTETDDLRKEIEFFVREIIYYKLDIRGYKSDIKKLKKDVSKLRLQQGNRQNDNENAASPDPSSGCSSSPASRSTYGANGMEVPVSPSSVSTGTVSIEVPGQRLHPAIHTPSNLDGAAYEKVRPAKRVPAALQLDTPARPQTPPQTATAINRANEADGEDPGISPKSVVIGLKSERRKPTPPSPEQGKFGDLATNFPLSTPAAPMRVRNQPALVDIVPRKLNERQGSPALKLDVGSAKGKTTPERPPRPSVGLFDIPVQGDQNTVVYGSAPPPPLVTDIMPEVLRDSLEHERELERAQYPKQPAERRPSNSFTSGTSKPPSIPLKDDIRVSASTTGSPPRPPTQAGGTLPFRSRENSFSATTNTTRAPSDRRPSTSSSANTPFVIGMGSPHNPAFTSPALAPAAASVPPTACSITRSANVSLKSPTLKMGGVGGTMASSTPVSSPVDNTPTSFSNTNANANPNPKKPKPSPPASRGTSTSTSHPSSRSNSIPQTQTNQTNQAKNQAAFATNASSSFANFPSFNNAPFTSSFAAPTAASANRSRNTASSSSSMPNTPSHSRNVSASSIRSAIHLPAKLDFIKGMGKQRKMSVGMSVSGPMPMQSPFEMAMGAEGEVREGKANGREGYGIGKAV
ncbi:hypothetical protein CC80DRAFT_59693 [Byssothecium circinans]|uniref:Uncharacterized protein n=1 Tax=Byssothecium circinans TaxID=147558 RepID=A0A6A5TXU5_9PLEO|nr:hypothetical protein CC80DRAFT_59693 [Byssothecium circinans]